MIATCKFCATKHLVDESGLGEKKSFAFLCVSCGKKNKHQLQSTELNQVNTQTISCPNCPRSYKIDDQLKKKIKRFTCKCRTSFKNPHYNNPATLPRPETENYQPENKKQSLEQAPISSTKEKIRTQNVKSVYQSSKLTESEVKSTDIPVVVSDPAPTLKSQSPINLKSTEAVNLEDAPFIPSDISSTIEEDQAPESFQMEESSEPFMEKTAEYETFETEAQNQQSETSNEFLFDDDLSTLSEDTTQYSVSDDKVNTLETMFRDAIKFDDEEDSKDEKNYVEGSVPLERKYRFFLKSNPVSNKFNFNQIRENLKTDENLLSNRLGQDEFDNKEPSTNQTTQNLKNNQSILDEYGKSYLKEKSWNEYRSHKKFRVTLLILLGATLLGLMMYNYLLF